MTRIRVAALVLSALVVGGVAGSSAAVTQATTTTTTTLRLDGVHIRPELALDAETRARGLMRRSRVPADGMLFAFPWPTKGGFWMKNTRVPLKIVFYDVHGVRVRTLRMTPCRSDPCPLYEPRRYYRFALELAATDPRPARRLGPAAELHRLTALAR